MSARVGRNDPCPCGSGLKYKRCCLDRDREAAALRGEVVTPDPSESPAGLMLFVETSSGVMVRRVPDASTLPPERRKGTAAEEATQSAASLWGLPDFVYHSTLRKVGSGSRELGDRILIVGDLGVVVQVKSREIASLDQAKERRWIEKQTNRALAQANGTIRSMKLEPTPLVNSRGREVEIDGNELRWVVVAVLDHPNVPSGIVLKHDLAVPYPAVVLLRRDWEFLFDQLKSIHAVCGYLERVAGDSIELGEEPVRYYELASADEEATPGELDPVVAQLGGRKFSTPLLPMAPAGHEDEVSHRLFRLILEDIAIIELREIPESRRLQLLAELDRLPVGQRSEIGRFLLTGLEDVRSVPADTTKWNLRRVIGADGGAQLAFGVVSQFSPMHEEAFSIWVQLRHHDLHEATGRVEDLTTVGVLLSPRTDGRRPWDTTMVGGTGNLELTDEELTAYRQLWKLEDRPHP